MIDIVIDNEPGVAFDPAKVPGLGYPGPRRCGPADGSALNPEESERLKQRIIKRRVEEMEIARRRRDAIYGRRARTRKEMISERRTYSAMLGRIFDRNATRKMGIPTIYDKVWEFEETGENR